METKRAQQHNLGEISNRIVGGGVEWGGDEQTHGDVADMADGTDIDG